MWSVFRRPLSPAWIGSSPVRCIGTQTAPIQGRSLGRHVIWGAAFTAGSLAACTILEHRRSSSRLGVQTSWTGSGKFWEPRRRRDRVPDAALLEVEVEPLLDRLRRRIQTASESTKLIGGITLLNLVSFGLWQIPLTSIRQFMVTWFVSDPKSHRLLPHLLSGFSHRSGLHLAFNMVALWSFGSSVADKLGVEQFAFVYGSTLVLSSIVSHIYAVRVGRWRPSLGASGGILGLVSMFTILHPDRRLMLMLLPFISFPAWAGLAGIAAFDSVGLILGWQTFDHAAHLGGVLCGYLYISQVHMWTWDQRKFIADLVSSNPKSK